MKLTSNPGFPLPPLTEARTYSGAQNHPTQPELNQADSVFLRQAPEAYADGIDQPSGPDRPGPRAISNAVLDERGRAQDARRLSGMVWAWGQFLDHDVTMTAGGGATRQIAVPAGDKHFDPEGTGRAVIPFQRSGAAPGTGEGTGTPRQQRNEISGWIDGSMVYGSDPQRAAALRTGVGGRLKTSPGELLPYNSMGLINDNPMRKPETSLMAAGDARANENLGLLSLQTLFLREHNRLVAEFAAQDPSLDDEALYQRARKVVGAQIQRITYEEYLPALLGPGRLPPYRGYRPEVDPRISNEFSTAAFRMGHSQVEPILWREGADGQAIPERDLALLHGYFAPERLAEGGIAPLLRGLTNFIQEPTDEGISSALRNMLFGRPGKGGMDLAALNIERGRDHGLPALNPMRQAFGLAPFTSFLELTGGDQILADKLASVYPSVEQVDPWVGMLCEPPEEGSAVGSTLATILADQFTRLRDGDRFWYQNDPDLRDCQDALEASSLVAVMRRNTEIGEEIDESPFFADKHRR